VLTYRCGGNTRLGPGSTPAAYPRVLGFLVHHAGALIVVATAARVGPGSTPAAYLRGLGFLVHTMPAL